MIETKKVYQAIVNVAGLLAKEGIAKDKTCTQGASYKFRGIDDVYNALAPFLAENKLCILPRMIAKSCVERTSAKGNALFYTTVEAEFDFVSSEDGSTHTVRTFGEAMDSGDKGCNKAMSAAYKYAAFQSFCIPTEGDNDTENQAHEIKGDSQTKQENNDKKGMSLISNDQLIVMNDEIRERDVDIKKFLVYAGVESLDKITTERYPSMIAAIRAKSKVAA